MRITPIPVFVQNFLPDDSPMSEGLERALKHFHHSLDASGGKGGHQKWTGRINVPSFSPRETR